MAPHMRLGNREMEALELEDNGTLCMRVTPLHHIRAIAPMWCAQRCLEASELVDNGTLCMRLTPLHHIRAIAPMWCAQRCPEPRKPLATLETEASDLWTAWTLGPAAAQVAPRGYPLEPEASEHHWPLGNQELEDAELRLELEDLEPEGIGLELLDNGQGALEDPRP